MPDERNSRFRWWESLWKMVRSPEKIPKELIITSGRAIFPANFRKESVSLFVGICLMTIGISGWQRHWVNRTSPDVLPGVPVITSMSSTVPAVSSGENARRKTWETPFNPYEAGRSDTEASAWQYRFCSS